MVGKGRVIQINPAVYKYYPTNLFQTFNLTINQLNFYGFQRFNDNYHLF